MCQIPRVFHQIWLTGEVPAGLGMLQERMMALHPGWELKLWTIETLPPLINAREFDLAPEPQYKADVARYELLARFGGVYVDLDFLFLQNIEPFLEGCDHVLVWETLGLVNNGFMAFAKNHPLAWALVRELPASSRLFEGVSELLRFGPQFVTRVVEERFPRSTILPPQLFCSVPPGALDAGRLDPHPAAIAVHLWNHRYQFREGRDRPSIEQLLRQASGENPW